MFREIFCGINDKTHILRIIFKSNDKSWSFFFINVGLVSGMQKKGTFQVGPLKQSGKSRLNVADHAVEGGGEEEGGGG